MLSGSVMMLPRIDRRARNFGRAIIKEQAMVWQPELRLTQRSGFIIESTKTSRVEVRNRK
ncbi:hypothetical protein PPMP20_16485 [Paraburkholderia phymatum]|uniref:hypothetical protein n=1 Tax=Paraburkholderia phymatum TaxID=148447 RepID=UPI0012FD6313|nr:hypothetical protein [Paraburkholderia phymatum]